MGPRMKLKFVSFKEGFGKIEDEEGEQGTESQPRKKVKKAKNVTKR